MLSRFLNVALNEAPRRFETKEALDLYAKVAASNGRYVLEHDGDRTAALDALSSVEHAYRTLGLELPREAASAMDELRRTPPRTTSPIASPPDAAPAVQAGFTRQRDRHRAAPERTRRAALTSRPRGVLHFLPFVTSALAFSSGAKRPAQKGGEIARCLRWCMFGIMSHSSRRCGASRGSAKKRGSSRRSRSASITRSRAFGGSGSSSKRARNSSASSPSSARRGCCSPSARP